MKVCFDRLKTTIFFLKNHLIPFVCECMYVCGFFLIYLKSTHQHINKIPFLWFSWQNSDVKKEWNEISKERYTEIYSLKSSSSSFSMFFDCLQSVTQIFLLTTIDSRITFFFILLGFLSSLCVFFNLIVSNFGWIESQFFCDRTNMKQNEFVSGEKKCKTNLKLLKPTTW